jgi:TM2 domain-containing membrane protein YozV
MMNCAYHPINLANARCSSCGHGLCPACDHRIKGYPYCQDCIVAGIDLLRRGHRQESRHRARESDRSPGIAALLGLVPGLGAAYNGQNVKALVHFAVTVGLWQVADIFHALLFGFGGVAFYLYSIYDAYHSAQRRRAGEDLDREDERLKQTLRDNTHIWGGVLVGVGLLSIVNLFVSRLYLYRFWPLLLVGVGFYLLYHYHRARRRPSPEVNYRTPPPSVIRYESSAGEYARAQTEPRRYDK